MTVVWTIGVDFGCSVCEMMKRNATVTVNETVFAIENVIGIGILSANESESESGNETTNG